MNATLAARRLTAKPVAAVKPAKNNSKSLASSLKDCGREPQPKCPCTKCHSARKLAKLNSPTIVKAAPPAAAAPTKKVESKSTKAPVTCWCGCSGQTKPRPASKIDLPAYLPGHDARAQGAARRVARGEEGYIADEIMKALPHDNARDEFAAHVKVERTKLATTAKSTK